MCMQRFGFDFSPESVSYNGTMEYPLKGIDVSEYQGNIDWAKVKASGIDFAILRAGYGRLATQTDRKFIQNYRNAKAAGVPVGAYWYSYAKTVEEAKLEAAACIANLKGTQLEYPIYYDVEEANQYNLGKATVSAIIKAFCEAMEAAGYWVGLYTNASWYNNVIDDVIKTKYAIWIAHWGVSKPGISGAYGLWQYNVGKNNPIPGIIADVDLDYSYRNYTADVKAAGRNNWPKGTDKSPEAEVIPTPDEVPNTKSTINVKVEFNGKTYSGTLTEV